MDGASLFDTQKVAIYNGFSQFSQRHFTSFERIAFFSAGLIDPEGHFAEHFRTGPNARRLGTK